MFRAIEMTIGHLPRALRTDPYVLGYFMATVASLTAIASNNSIKGADAGLVMLDVAEGIFGADGRVMLKRGMAFQSEGNNSDFKRGMENAQKVVVIAFGINELRDDPDIKRARAKMEAIGSSLDFVAPDASEGSKLAGHLQNLLFDDYVLKTYGDR